MCETNEKNKFQCWDCSKWFEYNHAIRGRDGKLVCEECNDLDDITKEIDRKMRALSFILCAVAALIISYGVMSFSLLELDVNKWTQNHRDGFMGLGTVIFFALALWSKTLKIDFT